MNKIVSLPKLSTLIADACGVDKQEAERFVLVFTGLIAEALATDGSVKIKGLGQFAAVSSAGRLKVTFTPEQEMAEAINAPFAVFEPTVLADSVTDEVLAEAAKPVADQPPMTSQGPDPVLPPAYIPDLSVPVGTPDGQEVEAPDTDGQEPEPDTPDHVDPAPELEHDASDTDEADPHDPQTDETDPDEPQTDETDPDEPQTDETDPDDFDPHPQEPEDDSEAYEYDDGEEHTVYVVKKSISWFWTIVAAVLGLLIGFAAGHFAYDYVADFVSAYANAQP